MFVFKTAEHITNILTLHATFWNSCVLDKPGFLVIHQCKIPATSPVQLLTNYSQTTAYCCSSLYSGLKLLLLVIFAKHIHGAWEDIHSITRLIQNYSACNSSDSKRINFRRLRSKWIQPALSGAIFGKPTICPSHVALEGPLLVVLKRSQELKWVRKAQTPMTLHAKSSLQETDLCNQKRSPFS